MLPGISDYYRVALEALNKEVNNTSDAKVFGLDVQEWAAYLIQKYGMEPIELDSSREVFLEEVSEKPGSQVRLNIPVVPSGTLRVITQDKFTSSTSSPSYNITDIEYNHDNGLLSLQVSPDTERVKRGQSIIIQQIDWWNEDIRKENHNFPQAVSKIVHAKKQTVVNKHQSLDSLAEKTGIPLRKKTDLASVIPTAIKIRQEVRPVLPPTPKRQERPILERDKFNAIIELIDNQCRQFERTPSAFASMNEEDLRDLILCSLNAVFEGAALGEAFQGIGKIDIHLRISQGEVFIAECKFWEGPATIETVTSQLLERLTWRDSFGVAVLFSRNSDFGQVIQSMKDSINKNPSMIAGSLRNNEAHYISCRFTLPNDISKQIEIHYLIYNLFTAKLSGRSSASRKTSKKE
ncbi:hypothetical protein [Candidatus Manganitrophus noduliformans]|uniref:Uncharacterized protein n=1 Tax=Candidatus Manganitrophus noduliformans TaxID=2606439 RepID=A0A7X6DTE6_9BACT|nr:hypothetical protein [Candidatus Manganitrophus noduliformans]NKE72975.1 hypothetical protein [Candidatus Manganitrophus noduliformans]